jgi:hypothetical protein
MSSGVRGPGSKEVPPPVIVGVIVLVLGIIGFFLWRSMQPEPEAGAGMTPQQKAKAMLEAGKKIPPRGSGGLIVH